MKRAVFLVMLSVLCLSGMAAREAKAVDISAGPMVWYAWWDPMFKNNYTGQVPNRSKVMNVLRSMIFQGVAMLGDSWTQKPAFLYGPALSVTFLDRWTLSSVFMLGSHYRASARYTMYYFSNTLSQDMTQQIHFNTNKFDLDSTLSYNINGIFKVFSGFKYQGYRYAGRSKVYMSNQPLGINNYRTESNGYGGGLGMGATIPLLDSLFFLVNVSGLYMQTDTRWNFIAASSRIDEVQYYRSWGMNASSSFAYHIAAAATTLTVGFRY